MEKTICTDRVRNYEVLQRVKEAEEYPTYNQKAGRLTGLVIPRVRTALYNTLLKEIQVRI